MSITLPHSACEVFEKGSNFFLDNSKILAYGLHNVRTGLAEDICDQITTSYAKDTLNWPNGRIAKPDIFRIVHESPFDTIAQCAEHFVQKLQALLESSQSRELSLFPHAFIAISHPEDGNDAILVLAYQPDGGEWSLQCRTIPIQNELGLAVTSLTMDDISAEDILNQYGRS